MTIVPRVLALVVLGAIACTPARHAPSREMSGFLDDYALLREGGPGEIALVYRNPKARWTEYHTVLLEPVTLWRSGRRSLDPVPEPDLARLIVDFESALRRRLGEGFALTDRPGPGVMRVRLAITAARATDPVLDILNAHGDVGVEVAKGAGPLHPEMRSFLDGAAIEGEIRDAQTNELLAEGVERRKRDGGVPLATWADVDRALDGWVGRLCGRLESRTGRR